MAVKGPVLVLAMDLVCKAVGQIVVVIVLAAPEVRRYFIWLQDVIWAAAVV